MLMIVFICATYLQRKNHLQVAFLKQFLAMYEEENDLIPEQIYISYTKLLEVISIEQQISDLIYIEVKFPTMLITQELICKCRE